MPIWEILTFAGRHSSKSNENIFLISLIHIVSKRNSMKSISFMDNLRILVGIKIAIAKKEKERKMAMVQKILSKPKRK